MANFGSLAENLESLDAAGHLRRVGREIDADTELMPLVRCQFTGLPESERTAWLFENVTDANGNAYETPVAVATLGPSRAVYRFNLGCETDEAVVEKWDTAMSNPVDPVTVEDGPVRDVIVTGEALREGQGLDSLPIPISTPGFDPAPFFTAPCIVTRDQETGVVNVGTYRAHVKAPDRFGVFFGTHQDIYPHWKRASENGERLEAAVVVGAPPRIGAVSVSKVPHGVGEYGVSGGLVDDPLEVVECETVDLPVPACAEIVIEGAFTPETYPEGPFGEFTGYMGEMTESPNFEVSAITRRQTPIYQAFISQMPPSESTVLRKVAYEQNILQHLRNTNINDVLDVALYEEGSVMNFLVIQLDKSTPQEPFQAMYAALGYAAQVGKFTIAVDEDIDPHDTKSVIWALTSRVQPNRDTQIVKNRKAAMDPASGVQKNSDGPLGMADLPVNVENAAESAIMIDATMPWDYPPTSLPKREFMERAREIWRDLDYPELDMMEPWYGESHGDWPDHLATAAERAVRGEYMDYSYEDLVRDAESEE